MTRKRSTSRYHVLKIQMVEALGSTSWRFRLVTTVINLAPVAFPLFIAGFKQGLSFAFLSMLSLFWKSYSQSGPESLASVERSSRARRATQYELIQQAANWASFTEREVAIFQRRVLELIATTVRDHRADGKTPKIFVSLMVERGEYMEVIARDHGQRPLGTRIEKKWSIAWEAMEKADTVITGDVMADYPHTPAGKKYASVLAIPVFSHEGRVLAVLCIDSRRKFQFDSNAAEIEDYVAPHIALLVWTVRNERPDSPLLTGDDLPGAVKERAP